MDEQSFARHHSVAIYFVLTFLISWIGVYVVIGPKFLTGDVIELSDLGVMAFANLNGPFIAGLLMTYLADGKKGVKDLFARMKKYKVPGRWYLPLLIFPVLLLCVSALLGVFVSPELAPTLGFLGIIGGLPAFVLSHSSPVVRVVNRSSGYAWCYARPEGPDHPHETDETTHHN